MTTIRRAMEKSEKRNYRQINWRKKIISTTCSYQFFRPELFCNKNILVSTPSKCLDQNLIIPFGIKNKCSHQLDSVCMGWLNETIHSGWFFFRLWNSKPLFFNTHNVAWRSKHSEKQDERFVEFSEINKPLTICRLFVIWCRSLFRI